ncbi:MAG TPA: 2,3,4,5-tetrahydropyridine-2,6-dicarboxylate N-succinyltransferase [Bacteroidota bacterium]|nr:2,3,4,5-tetrahydropyridine-2,6-dicarboxylate N-succinyltransferase [Bacteroidota bacterium]
MILRQIIERLYDLPPEQIDRDDALKVVAELKGYLNSGDARAASPSNGGSWTVHTWVKKGIILAFRVGRLRELPSDGTFRFFDKDTMDAKPISTGSDVRVVPGGTAVRNGSYLGPGVVIMPPSYVNIGAWVGGGTMIDSHVLVGSCAQIGARVHLSAGTQVGGVLEPVNSSPVIIEDEVFVGGNCGIYEGAFVRRKAVLGSGVILTGSTPVYDIPMKKIYRRVTGSPLTIPEGAVVLAGSRKIGDAWAAEHRLSVYTPVIVKYRDDRTDAATVLEECLR